MKHLDWKELDGSIVVWKIADSSQSFEVSRGSTGEASPGFIEGDFTKQEISYGINLFYNSNARYR